MDVAKTTMIMSARIAATAPTMIHTMVFDSEFPVVLLPTTN
jgi:hypothetical protein